MKSAQINRLLVLAIIFACIIFSGVILSQQSWQQSNGPYGGSVLCFDISPNGTMFAGTYAGGVFRSSNNGDYWRPSNGELTTNLNVSAISAGPDNYLYAVVYGSLHRSSDNGDTWLDISANIPFSSVSKIITHANGDVFIVLYVKAILRSTDHGDSWTQLNLLHNAYDLSFDANNYMYAGVAGGVEKSTDNGVSWTYSSFTSNYVETISISSQGDIYAGTFWEGIFVSTNGGTAWTQINGGLPTPLNTVTIVNFTEDNNNIIYAAINTNNVLGSGLYYHDTTRDESDGPFWNFSQLLENRRLIRIVFAQLFGSFFLGPEDASGLLKLNNPPNGNLENISIGLAATDVQGIEIDQTGTIMAVGDLSWAPQYSSDNGETWDRESGSGLATYGIIKSALRIYSGNQPQATVVAGYTINPSAAWGPYFAIKEEGSNIWETRTTGISGTYFDGLTANESTQHLIASGDGGIYYSSDFGLNWSRRDNSPADVFGIEYNNNNGTLYTRSYDGIHSSSDLGLSWNLSYSLSFPQSMDINESNNKITVSSINNTVYECDESGCTALTNGWTFGEYARSLKYDPSGNIYAAPSTGGVKIWRENQGNWESSKELENKKVASLGIVHQFFGKSNSGNDIIYAGTEGSGVWTLSTSTSVDDENDQLPENFYLAQNYPNPFNPSTVIGYQLQVSSNVTLKIYDLLGREVVTLVDEYNPAGTYEIEFDASGLPGGIYFYKLQTGEFVETKKMILIK